MSGLDAKLVVGRGSDFRVEIELSVPPGRTVALLGPNGAGKSTVVEALAGLVPLDDGHVRLGDRVLEDPRGGLFVPPEERRFGIVFQDYLLFPHMTVLENVAFAVHRRHKPPAAREAARRWLDRLDLSDLAERRPGELSGGQAQRAALARALIGTPGLLLLDEPLAALDVTTRTRLRRLLARHLGDFEGPRVLITHDPTEAFLLADEVHVLEGGRLTQSGTAEEIRVSPRTAYVADLAGSNLLEGEAADGWIAIGAQRVRIAEGDAEGRVLATIHPRAISIHRSRPEGSPRNTWQTEITWIEELGERVRLNVGEPLALTAEVTPEACRSLELERGTPVWVSIKATEIYVQPS